MKKTTLLGAAMPIKAYKTDTAAGLAEPTFTTSVVSHLSRFGSLPDVGLFLGILWGDAVASHCHRIVAN